MISSRRHIRHIVSPSVFVVLDGASSGGILYDICEDGVALDIVGPDLRDQQVIVEFDLPGSGHHLNAMGRIIWKNDSSKRLGLQFMDLPATSRRLINQWLSVKTVPGQFFTDSSMQSFRDSNGQNAQSVNDIGDLRQGDAREPIATAAMADSTFMLEADSRGAKDLRSSLPQPVRIVDRKPQDGIAAVQDFLNRHSVHVWIVAAACVFLAVAVLGIGIFMYASRQGTQVTLGDLKAIVTGLFVESGTTLDPAQVRQPNADPRRRPRNEARSVGNKPAINRDERKQEKLSAGSGIPDKRPQFEVLDSQNNRRLLPRGAVGNEIKIERPDAIATQEESGRASPTAVVSTQADSENRGLSKRGHVSRLSAGEVPTQQIMPDYPAAALQKNVQGEVVVKVTIAKDGSVRASRIVSPPSLLDSTVQDAVRKWRYAPHFNNGEPVEGETQIILVFAMKQQ
jgi:TonB family protein